VLEIQIGDNTLKKNENLYLTERQTPMKFSATAPNKCHTLYEMLFHHMQVRGCNFMIFRGGTFCGHTAKPNGTTDNPSAQDLAYHTKHSYCT